MTTRRSNRILPWVPLLSALLLLASPGSTSGVQPMPGESMDQQLDEAVQLCQLSDNPAPVDRSWLAVAASGDVTSRAPNANLAAWTPVRRGGRVDTMSHVRSVGRGQATLTRNGDVIVVSPGSELTLPDDASAQFDVIRQDAGKALYKVKPGRQGRFEVVTPMLVAGVKGTQFSVVVRDGFVAVEVVEGHVEVQSLLDSEDRRDLFAGDLITLHADEGRMEIHTEDRGAAVEPARKRNPEAREIRKETKGLVRDLDDEMVDLDRKLDTLWKERLTEKLDEGRPVVGSVTETADRFLDILDEKQSQKAVDDVIKILCGGTVSRGNSGHGNSGHGSSGSGSGSSGSGSPTP